MGPNSRSPTAEATLLPGGNVIRTPSQGPSRGAPRLCLPSVPPCCSRTFRPRLSIWSRPVSSTCTVTCWTCSAMWTRRWRPRRRRYTPPLPGGGVGRTAGAWKPGLTRSPSASRCRPCPCGWPRTWRCRWSWKPATRRRVGSCACHDADLCVLFLSGSPRVPTYSERKACPLFLSMTRFLKNGSFASGRWPSATELPGHF